MNSTRTSLDLLASRVQELEASNRRWKLVNALLALSAVSVALMGASPRIDSSHPWFAPHGRSAGVHSEG